MDVGHGESPLFGSQLRHARLAAGLTQEELAELTGVSVRTISDLERGRTHRPYPRTLRRLVAALRSPDATTAEPHPPDRWDLPPYPPTGTGRTEVVVPRQLPAGVRHFAGRLRERQVLTDVLDEAGRTGGTVVITAIEGMAGVGKTALAVHWAHQHAARFPDGHLYVNLRGFDPAATPIPVAAVVRRFLDALSVPLARIPADPDAQLDLYRSLVSDKRMLILPRASFMPETSPGKH